jgi:four helix bundle protein
MTYRDAARGAMWERTKEFALGIIRLYVSLPKSSEAQVLGRQVLRSGTSPGAQYREACRARSKAEFISKMSIGLQELEETSYWLELLVDGRIVSAQHLAALRADAAQLTAMFTASLNTAERNRGTKK